MPVFKVYFHVLKKCLPSMLIYLTVFLAIAILATNMYKPADSTDFQSTRANIAVINRDEDTGLIRGLKDYLSQNNTLVDLPDDTERLQDELFYRNVDYIAIIPAGFTDDFEKSGSAAIEKVVVPDSMGARYVDLQVNNYLDTTKMYTSFSEMTPEQRAAAVAHDLSAETPVTVNTFNSQPSQNDDSFTYLAYFGYLSYVMIALVMLGISTIMMVFNQLDLRSRNLCSPVKLRSMNLQLALGSAVFALFCWLVLVGCGVLLYGKALIHSGLTVYCGLNSLVFTIVCVAIGFLVGIFIKSYSVQAAVANVLSLGMSFLCGVFVPQSLMSAPVLRFASFLPVFWYVKANDAISNLTNFTSASLSPIFTDMLIQLGFAAAIFLVALLFNKQRRTSSS